MICHIQLVVPRLTKYSFQKVQNLSALQASLRFLPEIIIGAVNSFGTDALLHKVSTYRFVMTLSIGSVIAPLLMALMRPEWSYWYMEFWAMILLPIAADGKHFAVS